MPTATISQDLNPSESLKPATPFLKWLGGKRRLLPQILSAFHGFPAARLIEPFVGSGAVFSAAPFARVWLADINPDLINLYTRLASGTREAFIRQAAEFFVPENNTPERYYALRAEFNALPVDTARRATLFIYLNRHGFNGLCRYNRSGSFNVPFGRYRNPQFPHKAIRAFSDRLIVTHARLTLGDFTEPMRAAGEGDFVYCDPPYLPLSTSANFTDYSSAGFTVADQVRLAEAALAAARRGALVCVSNSDTPLSREVFAAASEIRALQAPRSISCKAEGRKPTGEILAIYRPPT